LAYAIFLFDVETFSDDFITHLTQNEQNEESRDFEKSINSKSAAKNTSQQWLILVLLNQMAPFSLQMASQFLEEIRITVVKHAKLAKKKSIGMDGLWFRLRQYFNRIKSQ
jgi:LAS superfamily LD-carboxypeptidase LdcB